MASGTQTTQTTLQSFLDGLFGRDDVPAGALHGRSDVEGIWDRWAAGEPPRNQAEAWFYGQFRRAPLQEHGAELGRSQSKAAREAEPDLEAAG